VVEDVNFWNVGCGIVSWFPAKIKLLNETKDYPYDYVYVVGLDYFSKKDDILNKTVEVKLSKLSKKTKPHYFLSMFIVNEIDSRGISFYGIDEIKSID
jgi:hypothetical protein